MGVGKNIHAAMEAAGLRPVDLASRLGITDSAVSQWFRKDTGPAHRNMVKLAEILRTSTDALYGTGHFRPNTSDTKRQGNHSDAAVNVTDIDKMPVTVVIYATDPAENGYFIIGGDSGMKARCPPRFTGRDDIIALYVQGDANLDRYRDGALIYLERLRPPQKGTDDAVLRLKDGGRAILGLLVNKTTKTITIKQYGSEKAIDIPADKVEVVYRVMTLQDLLGS